MATTEEYLYQTLRVKNMQRKIYEQRAELLSAILRKSAMGICEYFMKDDRLIIYDTVLTVEKEIPHYLEYLYKDSVICPDDRCKMQDFYQNRIRESVEIRIEKDGRTERLLFQALPLTDMDHSESLPILIKDITTEKNRETILREQAMRDSLTSLYNHFFGKELVNEYLSHKDPYATCGMMVLDVDFFKHANDTYGHLFGDEVLVRLARILEGMFEKKDIIMRAGGDEFVVFLKEISHATLVKKAMQLVKAVREIRFEDKDYAVTCSVGVCFLKENVSGYTYDQLFENADWALYRAKENGRNCYVFCDNLQRFELMERDHPLKGDIDIRYLHNDVISTAFEIFEKSSSFSAAMKLLLEVIGYRFQLDRITVIRTDIREKNTGRQYQWVSDFAPEVLKEPGSFTKEDFLTLFQSYDEYQTTVLHYDNMGMYSPQGAALLMQGKAKTVLYAAMYLEGKYTGAISYVVCREKRYWSKQNRKELGEVTKIISAHLARNQAKAEDRYHEMHWTEYDSLTGLMSFSRFRTEAEHLIVGRYADSYLMLYTDFVGFKYFNKKFGYSVGDQLLKEFSSYFVEKLENVEGLFFTRVVSDQFLILVPYDKKSDFLAIIEEWNQEFEKLQSRRFPGADIRLRTGVYVIGPDCDSASLAIDAANEARKRIEKKASVRVKLYDPAWTQENEPNDA
ncbi:MAG TPA: diguanylate cyclase [Candidatus Anaerobutyricum stercoripullorum]|uniref:Diguanylate cyclase n=1 Tax=Candidatus Anaerobutyricum stercoripullorum TaxID=2838456 RepID=A0A9D1X4F8_9FIRM|nr:diguanylate cyclase [Candidatus Anaerobutyricum stercoripullorum]